MYTAQKLSVSIGNQPILTDVNFSVKARTLTGIVGPNGSGKSTLLRALSGALPYTGSLLLDGNEIRSWNRKALARRVAVLQQQTSVYFDFTVVDFVLLGRLPHKGWLERDHASDRQIVDEVLENLELSSLRHRSLFSLSGGERQRVLLAQALVQQTDILILDEPTTHLDVYHQFELLSRVKSEIDLGKTVIAVFHDLSLALRFADDVLALQNGRLAALGPAHDTLTPELIRSVFRMEATLAGSDLSSSHIHYLHSVSHENIHENRG